MDVDKHSWSGKSKRYRKSYLDNVQNLYGDAEPQIETPKNPSKSIKARLSRQTLGIPTEYEEQVKFSVWLTLKGVKHSASANGGSRHLLEAIHLKKMGVSKGFPDIEIPLPTKRYHGLYIEMKRLKGGKVTPEQKEWINYLNDKGYFATVARGFDEAKAIFEQYLTA